MSTADELQKLQQLHQSGALTDDEFATAKAKLLNAPSSSGFGNIIGPMDMEQQTRLWAMLLHFSQLAIYALPVCGVIIPILIWQIKKAQMPELDVHGKIVLNWILSALIYAAVSSILCLVYIGFFLLAVLFILIIVFPIVGGIKANNGEVWKYPLSIEFFE